MANNEKPAPVEPVGRVVETKLQDGTTEYSFKISTKDGNAILKECAKAEKTRRSPRT